MSSWNLYRVQLAQVQNTGLGSPLYQYRNKAKHQLLKPTLGVMASWLECSTPERVVRFGSWLGTLCCVLGQDTLLPWCLSSPRCINGYRRNAGGNPAMD